MTVTNWPPHVHYYGITLWAYFSQTLRPIELHSLHYSITLWAYLSEPLIRHSHLVTIVSVQQKIKPQYFMLQVTWLYIPLHTCYGEVYGNIACEENGWLSCRQFIALLSFELSSFGENGVLVLLYFLCCGRWYLLLDAQKHGRIEKMGTHTHTHTERPTGQLL